MQINIKELIHFYDCDRLAANHSNALKTLAGEELGFCLLSKYFTESRGATIAHRLDGPCTPGTKKGQRLDGWFEVQFPNRTQHFQVEIKSWSFHGYGPNGGSLAHDCSSQELSAFQIADWARYWGNGAFRSEKLQKVLLRMTPARKHSHIRVHSALACLWAPVHPSGKLEPFFKVATKAGSPFSEVWVFSMSNYLRLLLQQGRKFLSVDMPATQARLRHLNQVFQI
ncbi:hypothetical protein [Caenimonas sp. SL110]|uniref:hypothetical protein n=1 Tax=Caenimonas sp. SL110 TaxID=1450524 RepID=UPI000653F7FE|nr:hypothetical protein [Caenimonas sp. SL110]